MATPKSADTKPQPPTPEAIAANKKVLRFSLLMLATLVSTMFALPIKLLAVVLGVWALVEGIRALRACWNAKIRGSMIVFIAVAMGLTLVLAVSTALMLARWDIEMGYQTCKHQAITNTAMLECTSEYQSATTEYLENLVP